MITINDYILKIYYDFRDFIDTNKKLCMLKTLNYEAGQKPDYSNIHIQQLYLLRYAFAYLYEYKSMFSVLFERQNFENNIRVTSIGCGSIIDYWGLVEALKEVSNRSCQIEYNGIDIIDWNYKIEKREKDKVFFKRGNAANIFKKAERLFSHVYIFPKSISEFTIDEFKDICEGFKNSKFENDKVHILISLRLDERSMDRDMDRSEQIISAMKENGFTTKDTSRRYYSFEEEERGIKGLDNKFNYPNEAIEILKLLNEKCITYKNKSKNCSDSCVKYLSRWPVMKVKNICFQVLSFDRKDMLWY